MAWGGDEDGGMGQPPKLIRFPGEKGESILYIVHIVFYSRMTTSISIHCVSTPTSLEKETIAHPIVCPEEVIDGRLFTKEKRQELYGRVAGGKGSKKPEEYQREQIVRGTGRPCNTTQTRIHWRKHEMIEISQPMRNENGFDYTENFDGKQIYSRWTVWVNLKSVVGKGGSQTRTLRDECYRFVNAQLDYLLHSKKTDCYFANIFDGDEAYEKRKMLHYLLALPEYSAVQTYVYVGDLKGYFPWITAIALSNEEQSYTPTQTECVSSHIPSIL